MLLKLIEGLSGIPLNDQFSEDMWRGREILERFVGDFPRQDLTKLLCSFNILPLLTTCPWFIWVRSNFKYFIFLSSCDFEALKESVLFLIVMWIMGNQCHLLLKCEYQINLKCGQHTFLCGFDLYSYTRNIVKKYYARCGPLILEHSW